MDKLHWTDRLTEDISTRLLECRTHKEDLPALVNAKWLDYQKKAIEAQGFTKEDALVEVLDLLDCNSCHFDLTREEYDALCGRMTTKTVPVRCCPDSKTDRLEILEYAIKNGKQAAADLLLLFGPDNYLQGGENYDDLMYLLTDGKEGKPLEV